VKTKTKSNPRGVVAFEAPESMRDEIEAFRESFPVKVTRSAAVVHLVQVGLDAVKKEAARG
jgi:hypothetical protein